MKILCVIDNLASGGSQRQIVEIALGFKEMGHAVSFLTYHHIVFYDPILLKEGITVTCIEGGNYLVRLFKMRHFIRKGKYDGVLAFLEGPSFICEFAGIPFKKWKLAISEGSANPNIFRSLRHIIYRLFHVFTDYVVANSYANMKMVRKINPFLSGSKCKVIYNIIDFDRWKPPDNYVPRKNGILQMIVVASHQYLKNLNGLIDALSMMSGEERTKIKVHWYGDRLTEPFIDNSIAEGKQKIARLKLEDSITFYPATNEITRKIQDADVMGLFSFYEGFPNVISEGMSCAKPIVCSAVSDLSDLFSYNRNLLCDPADPVSIKKAICYLINLSDNELIQIGRKNEELAKKAFDKENNVSAYLQLLV
jgi:glycosyltransferase involved in cell wall biosynthesis